MLGITLIVHSRRPSDNTWCVTFDNLLYIYARVATHARVTGHCSLMENFMTSMWVDHENSEIWHPTEITHYTVIT